MSKRVCVLLLALWMSCAVLTYGMTLAAFSVDTVRLLGAYPAECARWMRKDQGYALLLAFLSPISTVVMLPMTGFAQDGLRWRPHLDACPAPERAPEKGRE